ncbi:MAG: pentapeptide repeat-containing protein [Stackebrandtia sp.]
MLIAWLGTAAFGFLLWIVLGTPGLSGPVEGRERFLFVTTSMAAVGGTGLVVTLVVRIRLRWLQEQANRIQELEHRLAQRRQAHIEEHDQEQRITELRLRAVDQLGSEKPAVRIGGLNNLERLADQHPALRQLVLNEVCAYLRMPFSPPESSRNATIASPMRWRADDAVDYAEPLTPLSASNAYEERQVRLTAQGIIERHLKADTSEYWSHDRLDLAGAYLEKLNLGSARLHNVNFTAATFMDDASFQETSFKGDAIFEQASFKGTAQFEHASFEASAMFSGASFNYGAEFKAASFGKDTWFDDTVFDGVDFETATGAQQRSTAR